VRSSLRRLRPGVVLSFAFLIVLIVAAVWPHLFASQDPNAADIQQTLAAPSGRHWFGTDENGRDIYARVITGVRLSLLIRVTSSALGLVAGSVLGVLAAQGRRVLNGLVNRLLDIFLAIPSLLFVLLVIAILGPGTRNEIVGLAIITAPGYARVCGGM